MAKILLISNIFPPLIGGPATFIDRLAKVLAARGHTVTVVCSGEGGKPAEGYDSERPFTIRRVDTGNRYVYEIKIRVVLLWELLRHKHILVNGLEGYLVPFARLLGRRYILKIVGDYVWEQGRNWGIVTDTFEAFQDKTNSGTAPHKRLGGLMALRAKMIGNATQVIVPGSWMGRVVSRWGVAPDRLKVIENGVPLKAFEGFVPAVRAENAPLEIGFVGRLTNWKGVETLLLALQGQTGLRLSIFGDGPELPLLQGLAAQLGLGEAVQFVGKMEQKLLHERLSQLHVLALPSGYEGLSHTLLEAGAAGLARVASNIGGNADAITDGADGLLVPYADVPAWRAAFVKLRDDEALRLRLAAAAQISAHRFDFEDTVSAYVAELERATGEKTMVNAKKVVHLMPFYDVTGKAAFSGAENHLFTLMQGQVQAGLDVELLMVVGLDGPRLSEKAEELRAKGIKVTLVNYPVCGLGTLNKFLRPLILGRLITLLKARRDAIIHCHPLTGSGGLIPLAAKLAGCKSVMVSYHNNEPFLLQFPYKQGLGLIDKVAGRTIAISGAVRDHLVNGVGLSPERTKLVYYGIEIPTHQPDRAALRRRLGVDENCFLVGLVGRLTEQKDIPTFLKALKQLPNVQGVLIGGGDLDAPLKAQAKELGLTNLVFAGPQPDGPDLIGCLDVMVLPSTFEGLGLVLLEAMVRHVPIVGSTGGAIPEITEQGKLARIFNVGDVDAFAAAIEGLRTDDAARKALADTAFARASEKYTVPAMVAATSALYEDVAKGIAA